MRTRSLVPTMVTFAILAMGSTQATLAEEPCSLRSAAGDWEYTVAVIQEHSGPPTSVGSFHLDPEGHLRGTQTLSLGGHTIEGEVLTGTVTMNAVCTGSTEIVISNTPFPRTASLDITWENGGTEFHTVFLTDAGEFSNVELTDASLLFTAEGKRIRHDND